MSVMKKPLPNSKDIIAEKVLNAGLPLDQNKNLVKDIPDSYKLVPVSVNLYESDDLKLDKYCVLKGKKKASLIRELVIEFLIQNNLR